MNTSHYKYLDEWTFNLLNLNKSPKEDESLSATDDEESEYEKLKADKELAVFRGTYHIQEK